MPPDEQPFRIYKGFDILRTPEQSMPLLVRKSDDWTIRFKASTYGEALGRIDEHIRINLAKLGVQLNQS